MTAAVVVVACGTCGISFEKRPIDVARGSGRVYCSRRCSGLARRVERSGEEKRALKAEYDRKRREEKAEELRAKKREHHLKTYDPEKARAWRAGRQAEIKAYRIKWQADPSNRAAKADYDRALRESEYGDFGEAQRLLLALEREVRRLIPDKYERLKARGYYETPKAYQRKREAR